MLSKEQRLENLYEIDRRIKYAIEVQKEMHAIAVLHWDVLTEEAKRILKESDQNIEEMKKARQKAQEVIFALYQTYVIPEWE